MSNVNWGRFVLGALIVAAICFVSDGFLHQRLVNEQWEAVAAALGASFPEHAGWTMVYFVIFELGRGFLTMYTYVLLRPRLGPSAKTATWAGVVAWVAFSLTGPAQFIPLGFYSESLWISVALYQLVFSIVAAISAQRRIRKGAPPMRRNPRGHALAALASAALLASAAGADVVTDWDKIACEAVGAAKSATPAGVRALAIAQTAAFEAVNQITGRYPAVGRELATNSRYPAAGPKPLSNASVEAAVAAANRAALTRLLPVAKDAVEAEYQKAIAAIPDGDARRAGIAIGERAAADVILRKRDDGFESPESYRPVTQPGVYVPTTIPAMPQWPMRKPWFLASASQFRPGPPPALDSALWARDYNEIKAIGAKNGSTRTAEQTQIAKFWEATLPSIYHGLVRSVAEQPGRDLTQNARLFAAIAQGMDDALIAVFDAKYHYSFWRPVTAIRNGDIDGNDATERDASWAPFIDTPMHPEYPCAHCILSATVGTILKADANGEPLPELSTTSYMLEGVTRRWKTVDEFMQEVANGRIYDGVHFRNSTEVGTAMGRQVGELAAKKLFTPAP